jgi:hypothetical protein
VHLGGRLGGGGQAGDVPGAFDRGAQAVHAVDVHVVPATEGERADPPPERALGEAGAAPAAFVVADVALPEVDHLAERAHPGQFA